MELRNRKHNDEGLTLVEVVVALGLFSVLILSVGYALARGIEHRQESLETYQAMSEIRDFIAEVQETANLPQNITAQVGVGALYSKYNSVTRAVTELPSGQIQTTIFANETSVPAAFGGPQDLNFDGDALDVLGSLAAGSDLKLVPMTITLSFTEKGVARTLSVDRLFTKTTN